MPEHTSVPGIDFDPAYNRRVIAYEGSTPIADAMRQYIRIYRPHESREDTVLFPTLRKIITPHEYDALGEEFEKKEHQLFGEGGFGKIVDQVASLEKALGIYDLARFTPKI